MCGIVYAEDFNGRPVNNGVLNIFDGQRSRGTEGFGIYDGSHNNIIKTKTEDKILDWLCRYESHLLMFHHRFPTSTKNTKNTAHPFTTKKHFGDNEYILVHNGHIYNAWSLKYDHEQAGIDYQSIEPDGKFNDSESLLWNLALYFEGKQTKLEAYGNIAFICVKLVKGKLSKLYFGRNNNPLNMLKVKDGLCLSSCGPGQPIDTDRLYTWNYELKRLTKRKLTIRVTSPVEYVVPADRAPVVWEQDEDIYEPEELIESLTVFDNSIEDEEIERYVKNFMLLAQGRFDKAYDRMEDTYWKLNNKARTVDEYRRMRIFELAMRYMEYDPEWADHNSVASWYTKQTSLLERGK